MSSGVRRRNGPTSDSPGNAPTSRSSPPGPATSWPGCAGTPIPIGRSGSRGCGSRVSARSSTCTRPGRAFDHAGWNPEADLLAANREFERRPLDRIAIVDDLATFCREHFSRMPHQYWGDPLPRARGYVKRHAPPWE
nr:hypothetical protein [Micromonospora provocatoris]